MTTVLGRRGGAAIRMSFYAKHAFSMSAVSKLTLYSSVLLKVWIVNGVSSKLYLEYYTCNISNFLVAIAIHYK